PLQPRPPSSTPLPYTTLFRSRTERSVQAAIAGLRRAEVAPWAPALGEALAATMRIADAARPYAEPASLWSNAHPAPERHPTGLRSEERRVGEGCRSGGAPYRV